MKNNEVKAIITGGVSGLGLACAKKIIADGGKASLFDINETAAQLALDELGSNAQFFQTDVSNENNVEQSCQQANDSMAGINVAINCAGVLSSGRVLGREAPMATDYFSKAIQINLIGSFNISKTTANIMKNNAADDTRIGVRVMTIAPGVFMTPMVSGMPDHIKEALGAAVPFPSRLGNPEEFANSMSHIIENTYLNGSVIRLDGAIRLQAK